MALTLSAKPRSMTGKQVKKLRREGWIPAVLAGRGIDSQEIAISAYEFERVHRRITATTLMDLTVEGSAPVKALLQRVQVDPRTHRPMHLELFQLRMEDKIRVDVPIQVEGTAPAVSDLGGTLVVAHDHVSIRCDANHLVSSFHIDVSNLKEFDDHFRAGDLEVPEGVELLTDPHEILVSVTQPRVEREIGQMEETAAEAETAETGEAPEATPGS